MSAPDPEELGLIAKAIAAGVAIFGPVGGLWLWIDNRFAKKHAVANQFQEVKNELAIHRTHIGKIFDKLGEAESKNEERHRELLMHLLEKRK